MENVGESGEESEDEWNYFKGEGESKEEAPPSDERDDLPRSETPCQDTVRLLHIIFYYIKGPDTCLLL